MARSAFESVNFVSFDIFDTCIGRNYAWPQDLFLDLAFCVMPQQTRDQAMALAKLRMRAEHEARAAASGEETSLDAIYQRLGQLLDRPVDLVRMQVLELELEQASLFPIAASQRRIARLRAEGRQILFVSDMYLPSDWLRARLEELGLGQTEDRMFISGEQGLSKRSGALFRRLRAELGVGFGRLAHYGDNLRTDILGALRGGVWPCFLAAGRLNRTERELAPAPLGDSLRGRMAAAARRLRLETVIGGPNDTSDAVALIADRVAPLVFGFALWAWQQARSEGVDCIYCVSRDGQLPGRILDRLAKQFGGPRIRYLYGSRRAWLIPEDDALLRGDWRHLLPLPSYSACELRNRLRIDVLARDQLFALGSILAGEGERATEEWIEALEQLRADEAGHELLCGGARRARDLSRDYLRQQGLLDRDDRRMAILDAGWHLNLQRALLDLLAPLNAGFSPRGYYLGLAAPATLSQGVGEARAFIDARRLGLPFARYDLLLENLFLAGDHGSVLGYRRDGEKVLPVLDETPLEPGQLDHIRRLHRLIPRYAELVLDGLRPDDLKRQDWDFLLPGLRDFLTRPTSRELTQVRAISAIHDHDLVAARARADLGEPLSFHLLLHALRIRLGICRDNLRLPWLEGSTRSASWWLRPLLGPLVWLVRRRQMAEFLGSSER